MSNQIETELPLICYQSAGRVWSQKREKTENVFRTKYLRTVGYMDSLIEASNIKLLLNWCVKMEQVAWQKGKKIAEYEAQLTMMRTTVDEWLTPSASEGKEE